MSSVPTILVIDDLFGRTVQGASNEERSNLCGQYLIEDITGDEIGKGRCQTIKTPVAQAVFHRGQTPLCSKVGDIVENDLEGALEIIRGTNRLPHKGSYWAMILLDLCFYTGRVTEQSNARATGMPEGREGDDDPARYFGLRLLQAIHDEFPELPVVILSSKSRHEVSREFAYNGALGFLPRAASEGPELLADFILRHGLIPDDTGHIVGHSKPILLALRSARRAAGSRQNILIRGERGSGKELMARYIQAHGKKAKAPFVVVNSAALLPTLYASELFGIEGRVASGVEARQGLIKAASGGDVFFDEIGDMLPETQSGILRVLEYREVTPVGSKLAVPIDVRFLSATNLDIEAKAAAGTFRSDLLDRLREGATILLPPLRERLEDLPSLVERLVREAEGANPMAMKRQIEPSALDKMCSYNWPGNVRELRSCLFDAVNSQPDVEYLVPSHLRIPNSGAPHSVQPREVASSPRATVRKEAPGYASLDELVAALDSFVFDPSKRDQQAGKLPQVQGAYARLLARYLKAVVDATRQPTPDTPQGLIRIHPAIKLMTGDPRLQASKAADIIKQILGLKPDAVQDLLEEATLKEAYNTALRLRPRKAQRGQNDNENNQER
jgi:DNA-binding NtrC family response regulator